MIVIIYMNKDRTHITMVSLPFRFGNKFILNGFESSLVLVSLLPPIPPVARGDRGVGYRGKEEGEGLSRWTGG